MGEPKMSLEKMVIGVLLGIVLVTSGILLGSCKKAEDTAQEAVQGMIHFEDRETGLCYSLLRMGFGEGATMGLANVPCDSIRGHETNMPGVR